MDVLTIVLIIMQAIVGASHGIDKIQKHVKNKKKKIEQVKVEVSCNEKENED